MHSANRPLNESTTDQVVLTQRLCYALARLNLVLPVETLEDAFRTLTQPEGAGYPGLALQSADHDPFIWPLQNIAIGRTKSLRLGDHAIHNPLPALRRAAADRGADRFARGAAPRPVSAARRRLRT